MKRPIKNAIWSLGVVFSLVLLAWLFLIWSISNDSKSQVEARVLAPNELSESMKHLNPSIRVIAGFSASEYGGWHGDGGSVDIYLVNLKTLMN